MEVGIANVVITPEPGIWLAGFGSRDRPSEGVYMDLEASAVVFANGAARAAILAVDILLLPGEFIDRIRSVAEDELGITRERMLINCSHTHCGPSAGVVRGAWPLDEEYLAHMLDKLCDTLRHAVANLQPAVVDYAVGCCTLGINRRRKDADGKCRQMAPDPKGPADFDVPVLRVLSPVGDVRAVIFSYACHPTTLGGYEIGPDYPGPAREELRRAIPGCLPVFLQGCGGDVRPRVVNPITRAHAAGTLDMVYEFGQELARAVETALCGERRCLGDEIDGISRMVELPLIGTPSEAEIMSAEAGNEFSQRWAARVRETVERKGSLASSIPMEIQVLLLGDLHIVAMAGEMSADIGLELKERLYDLDLCTLGYSNRVCSYFVGRGEYEAGGYEARDAMIYFSLPNGEPLPQGYAPEAVDILTDTAVGLIQGV